MCIFVYDVYYVHNNICLGKPINILFLLMLLSPFTNWTKTWSPPSTDELQQADDWDTALMEPLGMYSKKINSAGSSSPKFVVSSFVWSSGGFFLSVCTQKKRTKSALRNKKKRYPHFLGGMCELSCLSYFCRGKMLPSVNVSFDYENFRGSTLARKNSQKLYQFHETENATKPNPPYQLRGWFQIEDIADSCLLIC